MLILDSCDFSLVHWFSKAKGAPKKMYTYLLDLVRLHLIGSQGIRVGGDPHLDNLHHLDCCCIQAGREDQKCSSSVYQAVT